MTDERNQSGPSSGRTAHHEARRSVGVQADRNERTSQCERRQQSSAGECDAHGLRDAAGDASPEGAGVPAGPAARARLRRKQSAPQRAGEVASKKYPVNFSTGPTVEVDGTEIKITP